MPRQSILSAAERYSLLALPDAKDELIQHYTFNEIDLSIIRQRRGPANRLGFAVQLCYLRFPGIVLGADEPPLPPLLRLVAAQLKVPVESWEEYGVRDQTRREHLVELQTVFGFKPFTMSHYRQAVHTLTELALQTDKGIVLASTLVENLRRQTIILPAINAIELDAARTLGGDLDKRATSKVLPLPLNLTGYRPELHLPAWLIQFPLLLGFFSSKSPSCQVTRLLKRELGRCQMMRPAMGQYIALNTQPP